mmetsp:Transcript_14383/g.31271  ORF Transcript_14383/g.31271 Transcript_14383/m.31271 type:complete len:209 (-) Transcript_14383:656-1282(-)
MVRCIPVARLDCELRPMPCQHPHTCDRVRPSCKVQRRPPIPVTDVHITQPPICGGVLLINPSTEEAEDRLCPVERGSMEGTSLGVVRADEEPIDVHAGEEELDNVELVVGGAGIYEADAALEALPRGKSVEVGLSFIFDEAGELRCGRLDSVGVCSYTARRDVAVVVQGLGPCGFLVRHVEGKEGAGRSSCVVGGNFFIHCHGRKRSR